MEYIQDKYTAVVLTGGLSTRMGTSKHSLKYNNLDFLSIVSNALQPLPIKYSVHSYLDCIDTTNQILDITKRIGPLGGIYSSLKEIETEFMFVTSCDLPLLTDASVRYVLGSHLLYGGTVITRINGKINPTFGIYCKTDIPIITQAIDNTDYKLMNLVEKIDPTIIDIPINLTSELTNINTPEQLKVINKPFVFCVSGFKNSGKTTLINRLIEKFKKEDLSVSILKHDGHDFEIPTNTDTGKFIASNANTVTIYSNNKYQTTTLHKLNINDWISNQQTDIIIIEGQKDSDYPKVVIENVEKLQSTNRMITVDQTSRNDINQIYATIREAINERQY